jgi:hypothetical protein
MEDRNKKEKRWSVPQKEKEGCPIKAIVKIKKEIPEKEEEKQTNEK